MKHRTDSVVFQMWHVLLALTGCFLVLGCGSSPSGVAAVKVANPGNLASDLGYGRAAVAFAIGKYEITNQEYAAFLNSVDPTGHNRLQLWNPAMSSGGGIGRPTGQPKGQRYRLVPGRENHPVVLVSIFDAMRYCNWLHNDEFPQGTEYGAYNLDGQTFPRNPSGVVRQPDAKVWIPSENEWFKAAYFDPAKEGGYWRYPVRSDELVASAPPGGSDSANIGGAPRLVPVGSYPGAVSSYGTHDQAGNVAEWTETRAGGGNRICRGGAWGNSLTAAAVDSRRSASERSDHSNIGFRIAMRGSMGSSPSGGPTMRGPARSAPASAPPAESAKPVTAPPERTSDPAPPVAIAIDPVDPIEPTPKPKRKRPITTNMTP